MNINKAIRKQHKSYIRFMLSMCFIFIALPYILYISGKYMKPFFIIYLFLIECLVLTGIILKSDANILTFQDHKYKIKVAYGVLRKKIVIFCDKIVFVHAEGKNDNIDIVIVSDFKFRNQNLHNMDNSFFRKYPEVSNYWERIRKSHPDKKFYYITIKNGGYYKYIFLDTLYRTCVHAFFSDSSIDRIKEYRN